MPFKIDRIAAHSIKVVVFYATVCHTLQMESIAAVFPTLAREHRSITLVTFMVQIISAKGFCEGEAEDCNP
ncbi:MAG: hypothetical protein DDT32_01409 [Syntrophomonadaceae bacterium]|nr:hypothetical protein [Bacillota bacterium]